MKSDTILLLTLFAIFSFMAYLYLNDRGGGGGGGGGRYSLFENWSGLNAGGTSGSADNQFSSNQTTPSNIQPLAPSQTDAQTSLPNIDGQFAVADPAIDSSTILPSTDSSGNVGSLPPMLLSPDQQIGLPSPPSKISFISGGDLRAIPCVSKGDQSQFPWGFSSYDPKDVYNGGYESVGQNYTCSNSN